MVPTLYSEIKLQVGAPAVHKAFAAAKTGWADVQKFTTPSDMVLSNPVGFEGINTVAGLHTNVTFSLYARRGTPISDLIFAQSYSMFYDKNKLKAKFEKVKSFFEGPPQAEDVRYIAKELKVKAILVTLCDGIWGSPGEVAQYYYLAKNNAGYRIYLLR